MPQQNRILAPGAWRLTALALAIASATGAVQAQELTTKAQALPAVKVIDDALEADSTDSYITGTTKSAMGLEISVRDTPQSTSVVTQQRIQDQAAESISDALRHTTGISVKSKDRARSEVSSRGFEVTNYQLDGVPISRDIESGLDTSNTAIYDRIEVVRGATGLVNGAGDPSATINLIRKRANSREFIGNVELEAGSWDRLGVTADVATRVNSDGSARTRFVASYGESESHVDLENTENNLVYSVFEVDLGAQTVLTLGGSYEKDEMKGIYWGALPYFFSDGSRTDWDSSKTTAADWNLWTTEDTTVFATLQHTLANRWVLGANFSYYDHSERMQVLYLVGAPDPVTGEGMNPNPYDFGANPEQFQAGVSASGPFAAFGRQHEAIFRLQRNERHHSGWKTRDLLTDPVPETGNFFEWDGSYPELEWGPEYTASSNDTTETALSGATRLQLTDALKAVLGGRISDWKKEEEAAPWTPVAYEIHHDHQFIPYAGLIYDLTNELSAYTSYSSIFKPQDLYDRNRKPIDPLEGNTYELGIKGDFLNGALSATAAVYSIRQDNFAVPDGDEPDETGVVPSRTISGVESEGYELELVGALTDNWDISAGWSQFSVEAPEDQGELVTNHPRKLLHLDTVYEMRGKLSGLRLGGGIGWQSDEPYYYNNPATDQEERVGEDAYALLNLMAAYEFERWSVQLNLNNVLDKEYKEAWTTYTSGEPFNALLAARYKF